MPGPDFTIPPEYYGYYVISAIVLATVWCFFGFRIFRFVLGVMGFILGAAAAGAIAFEFSEGREMIAIGAAILGGILGAGIMFVLYILGVFVIGAVLGGLVAFSAFTYVGEDPDILITLITAFVVGVVAMFLKRFMIILATSLSGAWIVVTGFTYYLKSGFNPLEPGSVLSMGEDQLYRFLIVWLGLFVAGFTVQYITVPKDYVLLEDEVEEEGSAAAERSNEPQEPTIHPPAGAEPDGEESPLK